MTLPYQTINDPFSSLRGGEAASAIHLFNAAKG
jgi:hypothetical protein